MLYYLKSIELNLFKLVGNLGHQGGALYAFVHVLKSRVCMHTRVILKVECAHMSGVNKYLHHCSSADWDADNYKQSLFQ